MNTTKLIDRVSVSKIARIFAEFELIKALYSADSRVSGIYYPEILYQYDPPISRSARGLTVIIVL